MRWLPCPGDIGVGNSGLYEEFVGKTGMTMSQLICYREHPIDKLSVLVENKIPVVIVYGKEDDVVPYSENGAVLEKCYIQNNLKIKAIGKDGCGHHPHGLEDPNIIADCIEEFIR